MNCVSSRSSNKKAKKGKSPTKMKPKKEENTVEAEGVKDVDSECLPKEQNNLEMAESGIEVVNAKDLENEPNQPETSTNEILEPTPEDSTEKETINASEEKENIEKEALNEYDDSGEDHLENKKELTEETEDGVSDTGIKFNLGVENEDGNVELKRSDSNEEEKTEGSINNETKSPGNEFILIEGSLEDDFVVIEVPGESNDDPDDEPNNNPTSDTSVVKIGEPFSEYVDCNGLGLALKAHDEMPESDMDITSELLMQYLTKGQKKQLKLTVRKAGWLITDEIRTILWKRMCQHLHKADFDDDIFTEYDETLFSDGCDSIRLPSFVDLQHTPNYFLNSEGLYAIKKVLGVLEVTSPEIVYSPMLYPVVSLFLHFMSPSECYNCLYTLLKSPRFISQTKVCYEASKFVIRDLAKKHTKSGYIFLVRNSANIDAVFDSWLWWILNDLPFHYLVRVIDCYLLEGVKVLYRTALSIVTHFAKYNGKKSPISRSDGSGNSAIVACLRQFCQEMPIHIDKFFKTGFGVRGLRKKDIQKLQLKHEMYINSQRHIMNAPDSHMTMSRSFSGPIILQNISSSTLTAEMLLAVWTWLPTRYAVCQPELLYTSEEHGISLVTLYQRVENHQPTIIVIKTTTDEIFGAFCSTYWKERRCQSSNHLSYFGTGETFLFTLWPEKKKYQWVGLTGETIPNTANMFQAGDRSILTIGGGHGEAIYLDENLVHCRTEKCDTFNNEPLAKNEDFMCKVVEVYGFQ